MLIGFAFVMFSGALFAWAWLPELQEVVRDASGRQRLQNKTLENLAGGMRQAKIEGEVIGLRSNLRGVFRIVGMRIWRNK